MTSLNCAAIPWLKMDGNSNDLTPTRDPRSQHLFVVRLWWEPDQESTGEWRGSVEHIASREKRYFRQIEAVTEFVRAQLQVSTER